MAKKNVALPGDFISTEEEFIPGKNTFVEEGEIRSDSLGSVDVNQKNKDVSVGKLRNVELMDADTMVYAQVTMVKSSGVFVELLYAEKNGKKRIISNSMAMIPARFISRSYVKNLSDCFRIGDVVKAKVAVFSPQGIDLRTNDPELGVVKAFCVKCRHPLGLFNGILKCTSCGNTENRKIADDYILK